MKIIQYIRIFQFSLIEIGNWGDADQSTGRVIHIPNGIVFTQPQSNYTTGFQHIWHEIPVLVTFESDWKKAKKIIPGGNSLLSKRPEMFLPNLIFDRRKNLVFHVAGFAQIWAKFQKIES